MAGMCNVYEEEVGKLRKEGKGRSTWEGLKGRAWGTEGGGGLEARRRDVDKKRVVRWGMGRNVDEEEKLVKERVGKREEY